MRTATKGFTLLELLIVISIMIIVGGVVMGSLADARERMALRGASAEVAGALLKARTSALMGRGTSNHGVYFEDATHLRIFQGSSFPGVGETVDLSILGPVTLPASVAGTSIIFSRLTGETPSNYSMDLAHPSGRTTNISVNHEGVIDTDN